jgi:hypothetical protein
MNYLVVPLRRPVDVTAGQRLTVRFDYAPGDEISELMRSVHVLVD